jgi:hypothetical protein
MNETTPPADDADALRRQVAELTEKLARKSEEAEEYRRSVYALLHQLMPYRTPTDEELHELMHGPRGRPLLEVIEELERQSVG